MDHLQQRFLKVYLNYSSIESCEKAIKAVFRAWKLKVYIMFGVNCILVHLATQIVILYINYFFDTQNL